MESTIAMRNPSTRWEIASANLLPNLNSPNSWQSVEDNLSSTTIVEPRFMRKSQKPSVPSEILTRRCHNESSAWTIEIEQRRRLRLHLQHSGTESTEDHHAAREFSSHNRNIPSNKFFACPQVESSPSGLSLIVPKRTLILCLFPSGLSSLAQVDSVCLSPSGLFAWNRGQRFFISPRPFLWERGRG